MSTPNPDLNPTVPVTNEMSENPENGTPAPSSENASSSAPISSRTTSATSSALSSSSSSPSVPPRDPSSDLDGKNEAEGRETKYRDEGSRTTPSLSAFQSISSSYPTSHSSSSAESLDTEDSSFSTIDDTNLGDSDNNGPPASRGLRELLSAALTPSVKDPSQAESKPEEDTKCDKETLYVTQKNLDGSFNWESGDLPQAMRDYTLVLLGGKSTSRTMTPSNPTNKKRIEHSAVVQESIRQERIGAKDLTDLQRQYLNSDRVKQKIKAKKLTVKAAVFEVRPSITEYMKWNGARLNAIPLGFSPRETSGSNWSPDHLTALKEGIPYEIIAKLHLHQVQGLLLGLDLGQVKIKDNLEQKLVLINKEKERIHLENKERDDKRIAEKIEELQKMMEANSATIASREEADAKREEQVKQEIENAIAENNAQPEEGRLDPEKIRSQIRATDEKQKEKIAAERKREDDASQKRHEQILEGRAAEDKKLKEETTGKLRIYFDELAGLSDEQLEGLANKFTLDEVQAPWFSRQAIEATKVNITKPELKTLKNKLSWEHINALRTGYSFPEIKDLAEFQIIFMFNCNLDTADAVKFGPEHQFLDKAIVSKLIEKRGVAILDGIKGLSSNEALQGLTEGLTRKELDEIVRFGAAQIPSFDFCYSHVQALQKHYEFKDIRDKKLHQLQLMVDLGLSPEHAMKIEIYQVHAFRSSVQTIKAKNLDMDVVLKFQFNPLQMEAYAKGAQPEWVKANPNITRDQLVALEKGMDVKVIEEFKEFQLSLVVHPTHALKPEQARKVTSPQQADVLNRYLPQLRERHIDIDEVIEANLNVHQLNLLMNPNNFLLAQQAQQVILSPKQVGQVVSEAQANLLAQFIQQLKDKSSGEIDEMIRANLDFEQMMAFVKGFDVKAIQTLQRFQLKLLMNLNNVSKPKEKEVQGRLILTLQQVQRVSEAQANSLTQFLPQLKDKSSNEIDEMINANLDHGQMEFFIKGCDVKILCELQHFQFILMRHPTHALKPEQALKVTSQQQSNALYHRLPQLREKHIDIDKVIDAQIMDDTHMQLILLKFPIDQVKDPKYLDRRYLELLEKGEDPKEVCELEQYHLTLRLNHGEKLSHPQLLRITQEQAYGINEVLAHNQGHQVETLLNLSERQLSAVGYEYPIQEVVKLKNWCLLLLLESEGELPIAEVMQPWFTPLHGLCLLMKLDLKDIEGKTPEALMRHLGTMSPFIEEASQTSDTSLCSPSQSPLLFSSQSSASSYSSHHSMLTDNSISMRGHSLEGKKPSSEVAPAEPEQSAPERETFHV